MNDSQNKIASLTVMNSVILARTDFLVSFKPLVIGVHWGLIELKATLLFLHRICIAEAVFFLLVVNFNIIMK